MKSFARKVKIAVVGAGASLAFAAPSFAAGNLVMPTIDLTDFYAAVGLILGVAVAVMIVKRVRGQIR